MEQKRILWIVVAICLFVLIIFGFACLLYFPSRSAGTNLQQTIAVPQPQTNARQPSDLAQNQQTDPDSWIRDGSSAPGLDKNLQPQGNINLTIVNGDNTAANYGAMDVSGLTRTTDPLATVTTDGVTQVQITPGSNGRLTVSPAEDTQASDAKADATKATAKKDTPTKSESAKKADGTAKATASKATSSKATATKAPPAKTAQQKAVSVTEYWIQTGSFSSKINAEKSRDALAAHYLNAEIFTKDASGKTSYRVRVGPYKTKAEAEYWLVTVREIPDCAKSYISEVKPKK
ncbi:MAG TPA: SPOR domain-containing protein [Treponemataceae bacterium]|nr:SPOR domain-containing protein [Treponemataceae bacterium]